jgi:glycosyltransferase involved in cell wall biosynthesis
MYGLPNNKFVWIFIGRIVKDKGINELVSAFLTLGPNHILLLVGPNENDQDPISKESNIEIVRNSNIYVFGFQSDVRPFIKLSDALVFPSYREGFPNVPMQAAAMGLPQIVSDINGCNEIVKHNQTGLIIPPKDINALSDAMKKLSSHSELRKTFSMNSRHSIVESYSRQKIWNLIEEEYNQLKIQLSGK